MTDETETGPVAMAAYYHMLAVKHVANSIAGCVLLIVAAVMFLVVTGR